MESQSETNGDLERRHREAEAAVKNFCYAKPPAFQTEKAWVRLGFVGRIRGAIQIVRTRGGENNLHYHTMVDTFWMVLKGRVRFYGPGDKVIGEFGPHEGTVTPAYSRYWFENVGAEDLELLQIAAFHPGAKNSGRTDITPQRYKVGSGERFDSDKA